MMNLDVNSFSINIGENKISFKLDPNNSKDAINIAGRNYNLEYGNVENISSIREAVLEVLEQPIHNIDEFQLKLSERVSKLTINDTGKIAKLSSQINSITPKNEKVELHLSLSKEVVDEYLHKLESCPCFSGVVKVQFPDGSSSLAIGKGSLPEQKFDENTIFNVMSVGKLFTAIGIMQLVEQEKIDLDAPIKQYLSTEQKELKNSDTDPKYIEDMKFQNIYSKTRFFMGINSNPITVRQLLTHTSGIVESGQEGYRFVRGEKGKYNYSNYGFQLLARIIETQAKISFLDYMQKNIFQNPKNSENIIMPGALLHMKKPPSDEPIPTYSYKNGLHPVEKPMSVPKPDGNGCWWMNANDLLSFSKAFMEDHYVSAESKKILLTPVISRTDDGFLQQGLGFVVSPGKDNEPIAFANQGSFGGRSALVCSIYDGMTTISISALCNCDSGSNFFADLVRMARGEKIEIPLSYLREEAKVTQKAIDWLLVQDAKNKTEILNYLETNKIPYHLLALIAKDVESSRPDIANLLRTL